MVALLIASHLLCVVFGVFGAVKWVIRFTKRGRESEQFMHGVRASMYRGFAFRLRQRLADGYLTQDAIDQVVRQAHEDAGLPKGDEV